MARQTFINTRIISRQRSCFHFSHARDQHELIRKNFQICTQPRLLTSSHDPAMKTTRYTHEAIGGKLMFICHWLAIVSTDSATIDPANQRSRCVICGTNLGPLQYRRGNDQLMVSTRMIDLRSDKKKERNKTLPLKRSRIIGKCSLNLNFVCHIICFIPWGLCNIASEATC